MKSLLWHHLPCNDDQAAALAATLGVHPIVASYGGDVDDAASSSQAVNQIVTSQGGPPPGVVPQPVPLLPWPLLALLAAVMGALGLRRGGKGR